VLFRKQNHEPLAGGPWDERLARYAIADIVDEAKASLGPRPGGVYEGLAGEVYALRALGEEVAVESLGEVNNPSLAEGELGLAVVARDRELAIRAAHRCIESTTHDLLDGTAGALVAADILDLDEVARVAIERLWSTWTFDSKLRACVWTHEAGGRRVQPLGMAHGLAGNAYALLRAGGYQSPAHQRELLDRVVEALTSTALTERSLTNWPPEPGAPAKELRVQWCHGAPGIVCALAGAPAHRELDKLLLAAGELTWTAGPLIKSAGLCHGTAGNGFAFLKLHRRTRDSKWLERARRFAMHAIAQRKRERGLFTGDLGVALYARACIEVDDAFPLLDSP
jgi:hypothetical protein